VTRTVSPPRPSLPLTPICSRYTNLPHVLRAAGLSQHFRTLLQLIPMSSTQVEDQTGTDEIHMAELTNSINLESRQDSPSSATADARVSLSFSVGIKLTSAAFAFFCAGTNDGSLGALVPYLLRGYSVGTGSVSKLYGIAFAGWAVAAVIGGCMRVSVGVGGTLIIGASLQLLAHALRVWVCPFTLPRAHVSILVLTNSLESSIWSLQHNFLLCRAGYGFPGCTGQHFCNHS